MYTNTKRKVTMREELARLVPIAHALVDWMKPYVEVVMHDLETGRIAGIYHNYSGRKAGDLSNIDMQR